MRAVGGSATVSDQFDRANRGPRGFVRRVRSAPPEVALLAAHSISDGDVGGRSAAFCGRAGSSSEHPRLVGTRRGRQRANRDRDGELLPTKPYFSTMGPVRAAPLTRACSRARVPCRLLRWEPLPLRCNGRRTTGTRWLCARCWSAARATSGLRTQRRGRGTARCWRRCWSGAWTRMQRTR